MTIHMQQGGKNKIRNIVLGVFACTILAYGTYRFYPYIRGVELTVANIHTGDTITAPTLTISGIAPRAHTLEINNNVITTDKAGNFSEPVLLPDGYNIVTITARDAFGKSTERVYHVVVQNPVENTVGIGATQNKIFTILN